MAKSNVAEANSLPTDILGLGFELWHLGAETQAVIAMRVMGMGGLWRVDPLENSRMVFEKPVSFAAATTAAVTAASLGKRPDQVMSAATETLREKTHSNAQRLGKAGARTLLG
ncbi:MAG: antifreeze protein [Pseudomonadota bacterium]